MIASDLSARCCSSCKPGAVHICGPGEWLVEKHAAKVRRSWRKLHIGVDADTGQIIAAELTSKDVDDGSQVGPLLEHIAGPVASFTGDGAYDRDDVYREVCQRHPDAAVIVPPRSSAVPSTTAETAPTKRDRHLKLIAERGRMGWQRASGYNWRALVEADIGRYKRVIGDALRSRTEGRQMTEVAIAAASLNRMLELGGNIYFTAKLGATDGHSFQHLAAVMTGNTQDDYAEMMLGGGRSVDGNRSRSGKNAPSKFIAKSTAARKPAGAKAKAKTKPRSAKRK